MQCSGDEDRTTQARRCPAFACALKAKADVVVELAELAWADTSVMLDLMILARRLRMQERVLVLRDPQPQIAALLELVGLDRTPSVLVERTAGAPVVALA